MTAQRDWAAYVCACGFRMERVPADVLADLPRCLGCGRSLRGPRSPVRVSSILNVRDLR